MYQLEFLFSEEPQAGTITGLSTIAEAVEVSPPREIPSTVLNEEGEWVEYGGTEWVVDVVYPASTNAEVNIPLIQIASNDPSFVTMQGRVIEE